MSDQGSGPIIGGHRIQQPVTGMEDIKAVREALELIRESRRQALYNTFNNRKLVPKISKFAQQANDVRKQAQKAKAEVDKLGLSMPDFDPDLPNFKLLVGLNFKKLNIPRLNLPGINIRIPNITLGELPDFNLNIIPELRIKLPKWRNRWLDFLPQVQLSALIGALLDKIPDIELNFLFLNLQNIFKINLKLNLPSLPTEWFDIPPLPSVTIPNIEFDINGFAIENPISINLADIRIPGLDLPKLGRIPGFGRVLKLLVELFDVADFDLIGDLFGDMFTDLVTDFVSSALPIIGSIKSGAKAANEWRKCAQTAYKAYQVDTQKQYLLKGDAQAAAGAIKRLLSEKSAHHGVIASVRTAQFATQTAGLFADLGTATGPIVAAGSSIAIMCDRIVFIGLEVKRVKAGNALLKSNKLDAHLFDITPVLGAFFLTCNTTSDILGVMVEDITQDPNWMDTWEHNKRKYIDPLQTEARKFIQESHFTLEPPPPQTMGLFEPPGKFEKLKKSFKAKFGWK